MIDEEKKTLSRDDDDTCFVLDKHTEREFLYTVCSLKQPLTGRYVAPLETQYPDMEQTSLYCYSLMLMRDLWGSSNFQF